MNNTISVGQLRLDLEDEPEDAILVFEIAPDVHLGMYDFERGDTEFLIRLTTPEFEPSMLGGSECDSYVRLAAAILDYAGGSDSGDHPTLEDDTQWKSEIRSLAHRVRAKANEEAQ